MSGTADVETAIWGDPWFHALPVEAKTLYLWAISNDHAHIGGLYVAARPLIEFETGLKGRRFDKALEDIGGKLLFDEPTGAVWVRGRANKVRSKTVQACKSMVTAVKHCPHPPFARAFLDKYATASWMVQRCAEKADLASSLAEVQVSLSEVHVNLNGYGSVELKGVNLTRTSPEVPSQSHSESQEVDVEEQQRPVADTPAREAAVPQLAPGLSGFLGPVADCLRRVAAAKPGALEVKDDAVAKSLQDFAAKDFLPLAQDFEHYWLHGTGGPKPVRDVVATWRNRLRTQPDVGAKTAPNGRAPNGRPAAGKRFDSERTDFSHYDQLVTE